MIKSLDSVLRLITASALISLAVSSASADDKKLTVTSFGGAYGEAQKEHMIDSYAKQYNKAVSFETYSGGVAELKAQVESGNVMWDVIDMEGIDLERACAEGLLEEFPFDSLPAGEDGTPAKKDFIPVALENDCGVGLMVWSVVYAFNTEQAMFANNQPTTIADLFDTQKYPGKRAFRKRPQVNLEWALMADGVAPKDVYEVLATGEGQQRAFNKLNSIKDDIVWFDSWSQAPQLLNDGGAVMVQAPNGRFYNAIKAEGKPFKMVWQGTLYDLAAWAVVRGSPNKKQAEEFIRFATGSRPLAGMADIAYGPTRHSSYPFVEKEVIDHLPSTHMDSGVKVSSEFWADYGESLGEKFNEWSLQ